MTSFLSENFLLENKTAAVLYHEYAAELPIIDYHNHLPPDLVANRHRFSTMTELWLAGDHYKWRAMRANGVAERFITGDASDEEKFLQWAATVPYTMRNPLYHWTHLELQRYFGETRLLNAATGAEIYERCNQFLEQEAFSALGLLERMRVEVICTTDDPVDSLEFHQKHAKENASVKMFPTFRPDRAMQTENPEAFKTYVEHLEQVCNQGSIRYLSDYCAALRMRHDFFASLGCRLSDHGLETMYAADWKEADVALIFSKLRAGTAITSQESVQFKSYMLYFFACLDAEKGWAQQFHIGALRNNNLRLLRQIGADCGADSIGDFDVAVSMARFFNRLDAEGRLAKTIIYNLNPAWNAVFATMIGNFQDGSMPGKMQFGSGWWFLDQKQGMMDQINTLSTMGLLSRFVGMLTDSRSFLSFPRHEYFRRILCNLIGTDVENGELPNDIVWLGQMVQNICYYNAKNYFGFE